MRRAEAAWPVVTAVVVAYWVVVALGAGDLAPVETTAAGAAAAAAAAALVGAGWRPRTVETVQLGGVVLGGLPLAVAAAAGGAAAMLGVAIAAAGIGELAAAVRRAGPWVGPAALAAGCGLIVVAIVIERADAGRWVLPAQQPLAPLVGLGGAGAVVLVAATVGPRRAWTLAVPALLVALAAAPELATPESALGLAALAVVAAVVVRHPSPALAALAVAAATLPSTRPAAGLLAGGAVLALPWPQPAAAALGLPGAAALAAVLVPATRALAPVALAVATVVTAALLATRLGPGARAARAPRRRPDPAGRPSPAVAGDRTPGGGALVPLDSLPVAVLGVWLLLAPGTWRWAGDTAQGPYDRGAASAVAAGVLTWCVVRLVAVRRPPRPVPAAVSPPPAPDPRRRRRRQGPSAAARRTTPRPGGGRRRRSPEPGRAPPSRRPSPRTRRRAGRADEGAAG